MLCFYLEPFRDFKGYYTYLQRHDFHGRFKNAPSYERFVELMKGLLMPFFLMLHFFRGEETGKYYVDSTKLAVCHNKRIFKHKVFKDIAARGKSSMGWFFGFKLHIVINDKKELMSFTITKGNVDDRKPLEYLTQHLKGIIGGDKGYISAKLFKELYKRGLHLIVGIRKTMKNYLMPLADKLFLRKRNLVETVIGQNKYTALEHSRHRSVVNFFVHLLGCLVAYQLKTLIANRLKSRINDKSNQNNMLQIA